ncbi:hypothetical protein ACFL3N_00170 [Candidatus Omnitrophota bacterium]
MPEYKKDIDKLKKKINSKHKNIPSDISDSALTLAVYYIEIEIRKRGGGLSKDFTNKFYELGKLIYKARLTNIRDIKNLNVTDNEIKKIRKEMSQSICLKNMKDKRDIIL